VARLITRVTAIAMTTTTTKAVSSMAVTAAPNPMAGLLRRLTAKSARAKIPRTRVLLRVARLLTWVTVIAMTTTTTKAVSSMAVTAALNL